MRLLNVHTLEFSDDFLINIPRYVIASHRWLRNTEITFADVQNQRSTDKTGYKKVEGFAAYVKKHIPHVEWFWIDTCCINKESDAETSEAINSMFKWYQNAEVCLAYLADVETSDDLESFKQSDWFRRGWTLQELLAPRTVLFLTRAWDIIGHKGTGRGKSGVELRSGPSLTPSVVAVTGIPEMVLNDFERNQGITVEEKLEWTVGRETTRAEDMSYCLLGMFDLSMSIRYGEGGEKARERLLVKIRKGSRRHEHQPVLTAMRTEARLRPSSNLPFLRDPDFVERAELSQLEEKLSLGRARVVLVGLGGVGKSQLAIEYCYRLREKSPENWVLWVHASNATRFEESIQKLADDVKVLGREDIKANIFQLVYDWLRDIRNGRWLLVLDNADDADFFFQPPDRNGNDGDGWRADTAGRARIDFLPICAHGSTIITSRSRIVAEKMVDEGDTITVQPMKREHALALLEKKIGVQDNGVAEKLAAALEYMPLAIAQAAAYIKKRAPRCSMEDYLDKFEKSEKSRANLLNANLQELRRDRDAQNSIILTWQISFEHINHLRRSAAELLSLMSFFDHQSIPESILHVKNLRKQSEEYVKRQSLREEDDNSDQSSSSSADESFEQDIVTLHDFHFISIAPTGATFGMHRLVQLAARKWLVSQGLYQRWAGQSVRNLDHNFPDNDYKHWAESRLLLPHAKLLLGMNLDDQDALIHRASVLYKAAWFAWSQGSTADAKELAMQSVEARKSLLGDENHKTIASEDMLASVLYAQGKYEAAEEMNRRALEAREKVLGREHPDTLKSVNNLAIVLLARGNYEAAEETSRRALEAGEKVLGREHPSTIMSMDNLAALLYVRGNFEAAEEINRRALETIEKLLGKEHPDTLKSVNNLAIVLQAREKYEEAEEMSRRALEAGEKMLGREHPDTLKIVNNLAIVLQDQGNYEAAEQMSRRALEAKEKVLGREHPSTLNSLSVLATALYGRGNYEAAEEMSREALEGREKVLGREHPNTLSNLSSLADIVHKRGDFEAAMRLSERAYSGYVKKLGASHPDTLRCFQQLTSFTNDLQKQGPK